MLADVLTRLTVVVAATLVVATLSIVRPQRLRRTIDALPERLRAAGPIGIVLCVVLVFNRYARPRLPEWSREYGYRMTETFYDVEGEFVLVFQSLEHPSATWYFSVVYVYLYVFVLLFPVVAYLSLSDTRPLRRLLTAYTLNYAIGVALYVVVLAYGPRQMMGAEIGTMLYDFRPQYQHLTREVNHNTNVFPSLHTSLSITVAIFAYRTREQYPIWVPIAAGLAVSVAVATMYLGIHWGIDVLAGVVLAAVCVALADRLVGRWSLSAFLSIRSEETPRTGTGDGSS